MAGTPASRPTSARDRSRSPSRAVGGRAIPSALWPRLALSLAALVILLLTVGAWLRGLLGMLHSEAGRYDFSTYYAAAAALRANLHANIYSSAVLSASGAHASVLVRPPLPYVYPPLFALVLAPFTLLSFAVFSRLWLLVNALLWLAMVPLFAREILLPLAAPLEARLPTSSADRRPLPGWLDVLVGQPTTLVALALAALLVLPAAPAIQTALTGQVNFLVLLPLALVPELTRRGHERAMGVLIGIAALLKFTPFLLVGYLLLRGRWRAALAAVATVCALTLVSVLLVGPGVVAAGIGAALGTGTNDATLGHNEALFASLPGAHTGIFAVVLLLARVALALAGAWLLWRLPRGAVRQSSAEHHQGYRYVLPGWTSGDAPAYGIALCLMLLLVPTAWVHHYVWVLPAAAIALGLAFAALLQRWGTVRMPGAAWLFLGVVLACLALLWTLPASWDTEPTPTVTTFAGLPLRAWLLELRALGTLGLLLALAVLGGLMRFRRVRGGAHPDARE